MGATVGFEHPVKLVEAQELQSEAAAALVDLEGGDGLLMDVKEQVSTCAQVVEVCRLQHGISELTGPAARQRVAERSNGWRARTKLLAMNELPQDLDVSPGATAVQADEQDSIRSQHLTQRLPAGLVVTHVVQHTNRLDHIEALLQEVNVENIEVHEFDVVHLELGGHLSAIREAGQAEVDGGDVHLLVALRHSYGLPTSATARNEYPKWFVSPGGRGEPGDRGRQNVAIPAGLWRMVAPPAGVGIDLVLFADLDRDLVSDATQMTNASGGVGGRNRLLDLIPDGCRYPLGPVMVGERAQSVHPRNRTARPIQRPEHQGCEECLEVVLAEKHRQQRTQLAQNLSLDRGLGPDEFVVCTLEHQSFEQSESVWLAGLNDVSEQLGTRPTGSVPGGWNTESGATVHRRGMGRLRAARGRGRCVRHSGIPQPEHLAGRPGEPGRVEVGAAQQALQGGCIGKGELFEGTSDQQRSTRTSW